MTSYLETEIHEQPKVIRRLLREQFTTVQQIASVVRAFAPTFVCIAARGTSDNAARYAQYLLGIQARLPVMLATPSLHTLYETPPDLSRALVIGISQSGQSSDVRQVLTDARQQGALTLSITNDPLSPLATQAEYHLPLNTGQEKSVAATKTYTAELAAVAMLAAELAQEELHPALALLPDYLESTLELSASVAQWVERYRYIERYAVIGRGYNYCTAYEISLKIKELCYLAGEEYSEADFRHGPLAMIHPGFPVMLVAPQGKVFPLMLDLLQQLHSKQAECLVITNEQSSCTAYAHKIMPLPPNIPEWLSPILAVIPGQLFALHLAQARGHQVDQPRHIQKVTVTQ